MKKKIIKRGQNGQDGEGERRERGEDFIFFIFLLFTSFSDLRKSDLRFSSGLKTKLIYAMRASVDTKKLEFRQTP